MKVTTQSTDITSEQNNNEPTNLVQVTQGGSDLWNEHGEKYLGYRFQTTGDYDDVAVAEKYFKVGLEFAQNLSENRVIGCGANWDRIKNRKAGSNLRFFDVKIPAKASNAFAGNIFRCIFYSSSSKSTSITLSGFLCIIA